jgi:hypothetical protein
MKTIVFCADGTWNGPGQPEEQEEQEGRRTNVFKLFLNLARRGGSAADAKLPPYNPESLAASYLSGGQIKHGVRIVG